MIQKAMASIVVCGACISCAQPKQDKFSPHPARLSVDIAKRDSVRVTWPPHQKNEPKEITACRSIWPNAHVRNMNHGEANQWHCLLVMHPAKTQLSEILACRQAILAQGWRPEKEDKLPPRSVPPMHKTASEAFLKENQILWFSFAEDIIKLKVRPVKK